MTPRDASELRRAVRRLAVQLTTMIVVLFVLVGTLVYSIVAAGVQESATRSLADAMHIDSPSDAPLGVFVAISTGGNVLRSREEPAGLPDIAAIQRVAQTQQEEQENVTNGGRSYTILTTYRDGRVIQAAVDRHEGQEELTRLLLAMTIAAVVSAVLAAGLSVLMARRAMRPMAESLALQRRFVADASHELRTPLTLISTRAQLLHRKLNGDETKPCQNDVTAAVAKLVEDSRRLTGILDDLLLSADPRETVTYTVVNLVSLARQAVSQAGPEAQQRTIRLTRSGSAETVSVRGSDVALQRVFTALLANALDHAETSVEVAVARQGGDAVIRVIDDGPGFDSETSARLFERFASARPVASDPGMARHYGLGLALVAEIVARHNGTIAVERAAGGGGASVNVTLPLAEQ
ncbi:HAMP domain-containing histidine kinase [Paeniglutamicibacter antarcticus]|uniref:histidine kinase n=1 Tax=Arthrobacter terrae TaxID=2935737 RepID=A0A931CKX9_9MICC|nr:HAMP domain-containing sensor histidine kinase [Arthrobacter terrae]MBG0740178.1 HAMP domain-containing histidine kinase [Arthrobacter terrae]